MRLANHAGEGYLTHGQRDLVYYALQVFVISGYLLHALYFRFCTDKHIRNGAGYTVCGIFCVSLTWMLISGTDSLANVVASMVAAPCVGGIGGAIHCRMSREAAAGARVVRCIGIGNAAAVILQYLFQIWQGESLNVSGWDTSTVTTTAYMFSDCTNLKTITGIG
ncbi:MAG: hypothetical protein IJT77_14845, partial [Clostridia bacterium]|nr:hypothetical protein [Clostridia bacterium]